MASGKRQWRPGPLACCSCERHVETTEQAGAVSAGGGILPAVPGVVCAECLPLIDGPVIADLKPAAAARMLQSLEFETRTERAVQVFLDLFGWQREVIASGAMRLHADGQPGAAFRLLAAAGAMGSARYFQVEEAALRLLDGETGRAHALLLATGPQDHPCWHLHRGTLAYSVGRPEAAVRHWREQIACEPQQPLGWQTLGFWLLNEGNDLPAAIALFAQATERFPDQPEFMDRLDEARQRHAPERTP